MATTTPPTTASTTASTRSAKPAPAAKRPNAARRLMGSAAGLRDQRNKMIMLGLFSAGAVLMPLGLLAIGLGWYGTAHSKYDYDQRTYLISGGIMGLGLCFVGGFLYFGAWLARMATDQRESSRQLSDTLVLLASMVSQQSDQGVASANGAEPVLAADGTTVHRRDCALIAHRDDLHPVTGRETGLTPCRVCRPATF